MALRYAAKTKTKFLCHFLKIKLLDLRFAAESKTNHLNFSQVKRLAFKFSAEWKLTICPLSTGKIDVLKFAANK